MTNEAILSLLQIIATLCANEFNYDKCFARYETCISRNHHTEAWPTRSWVCFRDQNYPDDSGDKNK
jgi:hypothetical protein